ncbi:hypothetical protein D9M69_549200 [compost metagenome]
MPYSFTLALTLSMMRSKPYSGVCTPITTSPSFSYFFAHSFTYGRVCLQLMQSKVQKSTSTTLPFRASLLSAGELSHSTAPDSEGMAPWASPMVLSALTLLTR